MRAAGEVPTNVGDASTRPTVYLHAGQIFATAEPIDVSTVLGSCVAVCLSDPNRGIGGANHYLLPLHVRGEHASPRYGNIAIRALLDRLLFLGARKRDLRARIFGGASLMQTAASERTLGLKNVDVARQALFAEQIPIVAEDVGGYSARRLIFRIDEGVAFVKRL